MYRAKVGSPKAKPPIRRRFGHTAASSATMMGPVVLRRPALALVVTLVDTLASLLGGAAVAQVPANAADEYTRLGALLAELESDENGPWCDPTGESFEAFTERGHIDARMQRWLDRTRPLVGDLVRTAGLAYDRPLDRSAGFSLLLPHLSRQQTIVKSLDVLMIDASRGDPAQFVDLLRAQAAIAERTASDGILVSSLVAVACGEKTRRRLDEMIDRGEIDGALAKQALAATGSIDGKDALRLSDALENEHAALALEIGRIAEADGDERARRVQQLTGLMGSEMGSVADGNAFSDAALAAFPAQADAFRAAARAVVEAPSREAALEAEAALARDIASGAYGELVKMLAPAIEKTVDQAWRYDAAWSAVRADLTALADGRKTPEELMDAGIHYIRAAAAAQRLGPSEQAELDSLRLAGDALEPDIRAAGKARLARLQQSITAEVYRGSQLGRVGFDDRTLQWRRVSFNLGLVRATQPGINGAVRTMLAAALTDDAVTKAPLEKPVASPQELAVAAVRVAAHYASTDQFGHSLAALAMLRDAADAIDALKAKGKFDAGGRASLAKALAGLDTADPLGLRRAKDAEWRRLTRCFAETDRLARLAPGELAFLLAAVGEADAELSPIDCDCPLHGAFLDMRAWFDAEALTKAAAARSEIGRRLERARREGVVGLPGSPLAGLEFAAPFDIDRAREGAQAAIARLERLATTP